MNAVSSENFIQELTVPNEGRVNDEIMELCPENQASTR